MKAREPDIKVARWVAMLQAADLIEQEVKYNFMVTSLPRSCDDAGCVLGWIGYAAGIVDEHTRKLGHPFALTHIAEWLGYETEGGIVHFNIHRADGRFYDHMDHVCDNNDLGEWRFNPSSAAQALRKLAEEMTT